MGETNGTAYAIGALSAGLIADFFGFSAAILAIGGLTFITGLIVAGVMREGAKDASSFAGPVEPGQCAGAPVR